MLENCNIIDKYQQTVSQTSVNKQVLQNIALGIELIFQNDNKSAKSLVKKQ